MRWPSTSPTSSSCQALVLHVVHPSLHAEPQHCRVVRPAGALRHGIAAHGQQGADGDCFGESQVALVLRGVEVEFLTNKWMLVQIGSGRIQRLLDVYGAY